MSRFGEFRAGLKPTVKEINFMLHRMIKNPLSLLGISVLIFYVALALLAPLLAPAPQYGDPYMIPRDRFFPTPQPPSAAHLFGTAEGQLDIFYGCVWGARTAFRIGFLVVVASLAIGLLTGTVSGYYGGAIDEIMMRFTDIVLAFPGLILAMALVAAFGISLDNVMLALVLVGWPSYTRVIRGEILRVKQEDYIEAAKAVGCSDLRVIVRHLLPNSIYPVLIMASLDIGAIVLSAAALSFLGLGAPTGYADWGQMISYSQNWIFAQRGDPFKFWYTFIIPGIFISTFVLGWNLLGDAFRDILDPTLRRR